MVKRDQRPLSIERACGLLAVSRDTWHRQSRPAPPMRNDRTELRDRIERLTLDFPGYGYRRVTKQLQREGWPVNHKRVLVIMRAECLLCQLRRRWVRTTDSEHGLRIWPNLLRGLTVDGLDHEMGAGQGRLSNSQEGVLANGHAGRSAFQAACT